MRPSREAQVLALAAEGHGDKQIATELDISLGTLDTYWRRIRKRYNTSSRTEAVAKALNLKWAAAETEYQAINERLNMEIKGHLALESGLKARIENHRIIEESHSRDLQQLLEYVWRTRVLMANAGTVMWWIDVAPPWTIEWISDSVSQWGYQVSELTDKAPIVELVHPEDLIPFEAGILLASRNPLRPLERQYRVKTKSGEPRMVRERLVAAVQPTDNKQRLVGVQMDIHPFNGVERHS